MFRRGTDHSIVIFEDRSGESVFGRSTDHFSKVGFEYRSRKQGFVRTTDHISGVARQRPLCNPEGSDTLQNSGGRSLQISPNPLQMQKRASPPPSPPNTQPKSQMRVLLISKKASIPPSKVMTTISIRLSWGRGKRIAKVISLKTTIILEPITYRLYKRTCKQA